jgi:hypothetical protein
VGGCPVDCVVADMSTWWIPVVYMVLVLIALAINGMNQYGDDD